MKIRLSQAASHRGQSQQHRDIVSVFVAASACVHSAAFINLKVVAKVRAAKFQDGLQGYSTVRYPLPLTRLRQATGRENHLFYNQFLSGLEGNLRL